MITSAREKCLFGQRGGFYRVRGFSFWPVRMSRRVCVLLRRVCSTRGLYFFRGYINIEIQRRVFCEPLFDSVRNDFFRCHLLYGRALQGLDVQDFMQIV